MNDTKGMVLLVLPGKEDQVGCEDVDSQITILDRVPSEGIDEEAFPILTLQRSVELAVETESTIVYPAV